MDRAGQPLDAWQRDAITLMLAVRTDGKWACFECAEIVARQNGKGGILEARVLAGLFLLGERLIMWSAHEYKTAMEAYLRVRFLIQNLIEAGIVDEADVKFNNTNGEEGVEILSTGQRLKFIARSKSSGRGFSGDVNIIDEAFAYTVQQQAALMPTMSARPNPQVIYTSSPPLTGDAGDVLYALRSRGEAGEDDSLGWRDWGIAGDLDFLDGVDLDDLAIWAAANPALGIRITPETIGRERRSMSAADFARERLGIWPRRIDVGQNGVIDAELWIDLADRAASRPAEVAFSIDVAPDRRSGSILMAGLRDDEVVQLAVVEHRPGTAWIPQRAKQIHERWNPVAWAVDGKVAAEILAKPLEAVGITPPEDPERPHRGHLVVLGPVETAAAWAMFVDAANQRTLRHSDDAPLNLALASAKTRVLAGGLAWTQRGPDSISPVVGATNVHWVYVTRAPLVTRVFEPSVFFV